MKLKEGFLLHNVNGEYMMVATGEAGKSFNGLVRNNATANFILEQLQRETTTEQIVEAVLEHYDAKREQVEADVNRVTELLRKEGFLDE